jgi:serine/threonine protein kinase
MDRLSDLLLEWEDRRDRGDPVGPGDLCPDDPALAARLAERIRPLEAWHRLVGVAAPSPAPPLPARIGKYEVRGVLGRGGMGVVYHGWDPVLRRAAAVKMIRPHLPGVAEAARLEHRFGREGRVLAGLKHPNIVAVYDAGVHDGQPYLALEYVPGGTLADHRAELTAAGPAAVGPLVEKVARAVQFAHDRDIIHRDLKPGNILLAADGEPLVADFGLAKLLTPDDPPTPAWGDTPPVSAAETTVTGQRPGTPGYMAPELADLRAGPAGAAADVWGLGVILYELLTGRKPYPGSVIGRPPAVGGPTAAHRRLGGVAARCLEPDPGRRVASAGAVADAVRRALRPRWMVWRWR